jgi:protein TonB
LARFENSMITSGGISFRSDLPDDDHSSRPARRRLTFLVGLSLLGHLLLLQWGWYWEAPVATRREPVTVALVQLPAPPAISPAPQSVDERPRAPGPRSRSVTPLPSLAPPAGVPAEPSPAAEAPAPDVFGADGSSSGEEGGHARAMEALVKGLQEKRVPKPVESAMTRATPRLEKNQNMLPYYPTAARMQRWQGVVKLQVSVSATGLVERVAVVGSSGHSVLDQAATEAVSHWRFVPARRGEVAVADVVEVPVPFHLDK